MSDPAITVMCGGCRNRGRCRLGLGEITIIGDAAHAPVRCAPHFQAGPNVAHGGWTAAMFDDIIGRSLTQRGLRTVTGNLTVDFFNPVPVGEAMIVEVVTESRAGRRWTMQAMLRLERDPSPLARAIGVWVERREGHFERHEAAMRDYRAR
tara:strand:+ start:39 stop:491 length:453 start_codon:yes stop_codon:yes gene_type:complete